MAASGFFYLLPDVEEMLASYKENIDDDEDKGREDEKIINMSSSFIIIIIYCYRYNGRSKEEGRNSSQNKD